MGAIVEDINSFKSPGGLQFGCVNPVTVASAIAQPAPTALFTTVSGTAALTTIGIPWPGFTGMIFFMPTGAFTGALGGTGTPTAGVIGKAFTAVVQRVLLLFFDGTTWWPIA